MIEVIESTMQFLANFLLGSFVFAVGFGFTLGVRLALTRAPITLKFRSQERQESGNADTTI